MGSDQVTTRQEVYVAGNKVQYLFSANFPGGRPVYQDGELTPVVWRVNGHADNIYEAERIALKRYREVRECGHKFLPVTDPRFLVLLDGDAVCQHCQVLDKFHFMDDKLLASMNLAYRAHSNQKRKYSGDPYIVHPHLVYQRASFWNPTTDTKRRLRIACAAFLHDVKEDCQDANSNPYVTDEDIVAAAGEDVFKLVCELTNPSKGVRAPRKVRKQMDRDHLAGVSEDAKILKMIDRICNLNDMGGCGDREFLALYASESRALWEIIHAADKELSAELLNVIEMCEK